MERAASDPVVAQRLEARRLRANKRASAYVSKRLKTDPIFRIKMNLRKRVRDFIKDGFKGKSALVGCTSDFLREWLQSRFSKRMNWNNYGVYWVVDHRIPLAQFDLNDPAQRARACHYTNLQPLTRKQNADKSDEVVDAQMGLL